MATKFILYWIKGASKDAIEKSFKKLAQKWHPEKHAVLNNQSNDALQRFKKISIAYRKLMNYERDDKDMSLVS